MTNWLDRLLDNPVDISDMPTVSDLREALRDSLHLIRQQCCEGCVNCAIYTYNWGVRELNAKGRGDIVSAEWRRHELIMQGYTPPEGI